MPRVIVDSNAALGNPSFFSETKLLTGAKYAESVLTSSFRKTRAAFVPDILEATSHHASKVAFLNQKHSPSPNPLISAAHLSFAEHYPLKLTPDVIWLVILQGVATHINSDPERYRSVLVAHEGKKKLDVRCDDIVRGNSSTKWAGEPPPCGCNVCNDTDFSNLP
jgi:Domain of unknown function (DUF4419)